jgi:hypothetical protein
MKKTLMKSTALLVVAIFVFSMFPLSHAQDQSKLLIFNVTDKPDSPNIIEINVTIPAMLVNYYAAKNHDLFLPSDFVKFVTPYALKPVADSLWEIYNNTEDFTNGVLEIVHQITYNETIPGKYPVETLADGLGDCDLFSEIAASILEAGGINVVLLYYKSANESEAGHMNIAVQLPSAPTEARGESYSVTYMGDKYYIAECTGGVWQTGWRVGECPNDYKTASPDIISLENCEKTSIGTVYTSSKMPDPSQLSVKPSGGMLFDGSQVTLTGQITPEVADQNVTLYAKNSNSDWAIIGSALTRNDGTFEYAWSLPNGGDYLFKASWIGNEQYFGSTSPEVSAFVLPNLTYIILAAALILVGVTSIIVLLVKRRGKTKIVPETAPAITFES